MTSYVGRAAILIALAAIAGCGGDGKPAAEQMPSCDTGSGGVVGLPGLPAPGQDTRAAGGVVSTSVHFIHVGLTGQGKAVGSSASMSAQHLGGATQVMGR